MNANCNTNTNIHTDTDTNTNCNTTNTTEGNHDNDNAQDNTQNTPQGTTYITHTNNQTQNLPIATQPAPVILQHQHDDPPAIDTSNDDGYDSLDSDIELAMEHQGPPKPQRTQRKEAPTQLPQRERHAYRSQNGEGWSIGDDGSRYLQSEKEMRVAAVNINKNAWNKLHEFALDWTQANQLDVLIIADADINTEITKLWTTDTTGRAKPHMTIYSSQRVAIAFSSTRWESRIIKKDITKSRSGRSICVPVRAGKKGIIWIIGTYCPDSPSKNREATTEEWEWLETTSLRGNNLGATVIMGGDFNTYGSNPNDRPSRAQRNPESIRTGELFEQMMERINLSSTFRQKHPETTRYTFRRRKTGTQVTLDGIYAPNTSQQRILESGIWMDSFHESDHCGAPFVTLKLKKTEATPRQLQGIRPMKQVNTREKTKYEMDTFTKAVQQQLDLGMATISPMIKPNATNEETKVWLDTAITNLHQILYKCGANLWGEQDQTQRQRQRAIAIKKTQRCHGYLKTLRQLAQETNATDQELKTKIKRIPWPRWITLADHLPPTAAHRPASQKLHNWCSNTENSPSPPDWMTWIDKTWQLWQQVRRTRWNWRATRLRQIQEAERSAFFDNHETGKFLKKTMKARTPPLHITSVMVQDDNGTKYLSNNREDVEKGLQDLLNQWVPQDEKPRRPTHLDTWLTRRQIQCTHIY